MSYLEKVDRYLDSLKVGKSALVDSWFMMSSPVPVFAVVTAYLVGIRIIPKIMKNRPPLLMDNVIRYYNAFQVIFSIFMFLKSFQLSLFRDGVIYAGCRYSSATQSVPLLELGWYYFFAKVTELLDTIFFVLRKKNNQVTFLHVYHHASMVIYAWSYLKFAAGGQGAILAVLNSLVHVVMYGYYFLSGFGPKFQKYLWWKKYVTTVQLIQFVIMLVYCVWTHFSPKCQYASGFTYFISINVTVFLILFLNFYSKSYKQRPRKDDKEANDFFQNGVCYGAHVTVKASTNGYNKVQVDANGVNNVKNTKEDHLDDDLIPREVNGACGDYIKNNKVFLTRRTAKMAYRGNGDFNFDSVLKK